MIHANRKIHSVIMNVDPLELLSGEIEASRLPPDLRFLTPDYEINKLWEMGLIRQPILDQLYQEKNVALPDWPDKKNFAVCLTHDVDMVSLYHPKQAMRRTALAAKTFMKQPTKRHASHIIHGIYTGVKGAFAFKDPITRFEKWLEIEQEVGATSTFFFTPESSIKPHASDCSYTYSDKIQFDGQVCSVGEMIIELDRRGCEIGLHPSWWSYDNHEIMSRQKDQLEQVLKKDILSVRQHFLHYDIRITPMIQEQAGFKYDSSLGFNNEVGFRFGTSYPWKVKAGSRNSPTGILEIPLVVQDMAMMNPKKGLMWKPEEAYQETLKIAHKVREVGGVLTLLWHPDTLDRPHVVQVYRDLLQELETLNPWFANVQQIGDWWASNNKLEVGS